MQTRADLPGLDLGRFSTWLRGQLPVTGSALSGTLIAGGKSNLTRTDELRASLLDFMETHIYPAEPVFREQLSQLDDRWAWDAVPIMTELRAEARRRNVWNLFLPGEEGAGLTNLQYAPLAEITGRSGHLAPATLNCAAPDTGNMEIAGP